MPEVEIVKIDVATKKSQKVLDFVAEEKPLQILVNRTHYATIFCTPSNLRELAIGYLFSEGILKSTQEIEGVEVKEKECTVTLKLGADAEKRLKQAKHLSRVVLSACGSTEAFQFRGTVPKIKSNFSVKAEVIEDCVRRLNTAAETFRRTGGVHAAAVCGGDGTVVAFAEDVGRHNAVDKVVGSAALNGVSLGECFVASTGRLTGDIVLKAARVGIPIVASLAAALDSGIVVAKEADLTLIGFVRGKRMNVYSSVRRVVV